jgi:hypothetical protein
MQQEGVRMRSPIPRRFTLIDAMVLIAATAIALVLIRPFLADFSFPVVVHSPVDVLILGLTVCVSLEPLALTSSLALGLLRLRKPRPRLRQVFRQPGMAACWATGICTLFIIIIYLISYFMIIFELRRFAFGDYFLFENAGLVLFSFTGWAICAVWTVLWLAGVWRAEHSWIDRAGRVLGVYWVSNSVISFPVLFY